MPALRASRPRRCLELAFGAWIALGPAPAAAQYVLVSPAGDSLSFESTELRDWLETSRALYANLQEDPRVLYWMPPARQDVSERHPEPSYPWNVVTVVSDSVADLQGLPANLREADRAYYNYAVNRMRVVRSTDPDVSCDSLLSLEREVVSSFADGWVVSRTLFGGPPFTPLDEIVFARAAGHLTALIAARNDRQIGACAAEWALGHPAAIADYEAWRREHFPIPDLEESDEAADSMPGDGLRPPIPQGPVDGRGPPGRPPAGPSESE